jgi:hypothetical protein
LCHAIEGMADSNCVFSTDPVKLVEKRVESSILQVELSKRESLTEKSGEFLLHQLVDDLDKTTRSDTTSECALKKRLGTPV